MAKVKWKDGGKWGTLDITWGDYQLVEEVAEVIDVDGIGTKGVVLIPRYVHPKIKNNINYYLQQAGIIDSSPNTQVQLTNDIR